MLTFAASKDGKCNEDDEHTYGDGAARAAESAEPGAESGSGLFVVWIFQSDTHLILLINSIFLIIHGLVLY